MCIEIANTATPPPQVQDGHTWTVIARAREAFVLSARAWQEADFISDVQEVLVRTVCRIGDMLRESPETGNSFKKP